MGEHDEFDSSEGRTPTKPGVRPPSAEAARLWNVAAILNSLATEYSTAAGRLDQLAPDERRLYLERLAKDGRQTARAVKAESVGLVPPQGGNGRVP